MANHNVSPDLDMTSDHDSLWVGKVGARRNFPPDFTTREKEKKPSQRISGVPGSPDQRGGQFPVAYVGIQGMWHVWIMPLRLPLSTPCIYGYLA